MKCVISGTNIKIFGRAIHALSKIGDELYVQALENGFSLRTLNLARSAYACILFLPEFFMVYKDFNASQQSSSESSQLSLKCKINMKPVYSIFKTLQQIDKTVDRCEVKLDLKQDKLVFKMYCKHGITKTHHLPFIECESMEAVFSKTDNPNYICCQSKFLQDVVMNFQPNLEEITFDILTDNTIVSNYIDKENDTNKATRTELILSNQEFDIYHCNIECKLTFCIKEFKAMLLFAEPVNLPISIYFDLAGNPMILSCETESCFKVDFVLATLADSAAILLSQKAASIQPSVITKNKGPGAKNSKSKQQKISNNSQILSKENRVENCANVMPIKSSQDESFDLSFNAMKNLIALNPIQNGDRISQNTTANHLPKKLDEEKSNPNVNIISNNLNFTKEKNNSNKNVPITLNTSSLNVSPANALGANMMLNTLGNNIILDNLGVNGALKNFPTSAITCKDKLFSNFLTSDDTMGEESDDAYSDIIPVTKKNLVNESTNHSSPPNKKFRSLFFGFSQESAVIVNTQNRPNILVSDSDDENG